MMYNELFTNIPLKNKAKYINCYLMWFVWIHVSTQHRFSLELHFSAISWLGNIDSHATVGDRIFIKVQFSSIR